MPSAIVDKGMKRKLLDYLSKNANSITSVMDWQIEKEGSILIVSLFVTNYMYWWTKFPPVHTSVTFMQIEMLHNYLESLVRKNEQSDLKGN